MKSPNAGLRIAAVAAAFFMLAACSSTATDTGGSSSGAGAITPGTQEDLVTNVGDRVFFDTDKSSLSDEARATLQRQAAWMQLYPNLTFTLEGHADERGTREYNLALGGRRANAAKDYLVSLGVNAKPDQHRVLWQGTSGLPRLQRRLLGPEPSCRDGGCVRRRELNGLVAGQHVLSGALFRTSRKGASSIRARNIRAPILS